MEVKSNLCPGNVVFFLVYAHKSMDGTCEFESCSVLIIESKHEQDRYKILLKDRLCWTSSICLFITKQQLESFLQSEVYSFNAGLTWAIEDDEQIYYNNNSNL